MHGNKHLIYCELGVSTLIILDLSSHNLLLFFVLCQEEGGVTPMII